MAFANHNSIFLGGNLGFETAAFKLSREMVDLFGGMRSETFAVFVDLVVKAFLAAREVMDSILAVVSCMADSGLPCFTAKLNNVTQLRNRFFPTMTAVDAAQAMRGLVFDAAAKWTTTAYDGVQKLQNNIYSETWR